MKERRATNDIVERAVAVESLAFLEQQMTSSFAIVGIEIKTANFIEVYNQYKEYLYRSYMLNFIRIDGIIQFIPQMKWEIKELHNEHNSVYLDRLIQFILDQREKLKSLSGGVIPLNAQKDIFVQLAEHCLSTLLEQYGKVKKLS